MSSTSLASPTNSRRTPLSPQTVTTLTPTNTTNGQTTTGLKLSEGVLFIRYRDATDTNNSQPQPILLFAAGHGSSIRGGGPNAPARRLYLATRNDGAKSSGGMDWQVECMQLVMLKDIWVGKGVGPFSPQAAEDRCLRLESIGSTLFLEAASSSARSAFLAQLLALLRQESISVNYHGPSVLMTAVEAEPDRPDAIHYVVSHLFNAASERFNTASLGREGCGVQIKEGQPLTLNGPSAAPTKPPMPSSPAPPLPTSPPVSPAVVTPAKPTPAPIDSKPLLLQFSLVCQNIFGLVVPDNQPTSSVIPYTLIRNTPGQPTYAELAVAFYERNPSTNKVRYVDHSEIVHARLDASASFNKPVEKMFYFVYQPNSKQRLLFSLYDVGLNKSALEKQQRAEDHAAGRPPSSDEIHVQERSRLGTSEIGLDDIMRAHPYLSTPTETSHKLHSTITNHNNQDIAQYLQHEGSNYQITITVIPDGVIPPEPVKPIVQQAPASVPVPSQQQVRSSPSADSLPVSSSSPATAKPTTSQPSSHPGTASNGIVTATPPTVGHIRPADPESMKFKEKLNFYEAVGNETWMGSSSTNIANKEDFVPTKEYWDAQAEAKAEEPPLTTGRRTSLTNANPNAPASSASQANGNTTASGSSTTSTPPSTAPTASLSVNAAAPSSSVTPSSQPVVEGGKQKALLKLQASHLHPSVSHHSNVSLNSFSNMVVIFSQESVTSHLFTFIGHSEIVAREPNPKFQTVFNLNYVPDAHRSILVHIYDGARAASLMNNTVGGGIGGLGSLTDDLLCSFVLDMDDLATAVKGTQLVYAPQQTTDRYRLRYVRAGCLDADQQEEPRIMVAFTVVDESLKQQLAAAPPPSSANANNKQSNGPLSPLSKTLARSDPMTNDLPKLDAESAAQIQQLLVNGSIMTVFHSSASPLGVTNNGASSNDGLEGYDPDDPHSFYHIPAFQKSNKALSSRSFFIDLASKRVFWSDPGTRIMKLENSFKLANLLGLVVGKYTKVLATSPEAVLTPVSNCFSICALYEVPRSNNPLMSAMETTLIPITLDLASFSPRIREQWIAGLSFLFKQHQASGYSSELPILHSEPDMDALQSLHGQEAERALLERRKRIVALRAAQAAGLGMLPTPPVISEKTHLTTKAAAAGRKKDDSDDEADLANFSSDDDDSDDEKKTKKKKAKSNVAPIAAPILPAVPTPAAAIPSGPMTTVGGVAIPEAYFQPLPLSTSTDLSIQVSCSSLFGLDESRPSDMVLAVFQGAASFDLAKPAAPGALSFSPGATFKYNLLDNSDSIKGDLNPSWAAKPFVCNIHPGASASEQHLRINLYDAAGDGVTAKDQLGLCWIDLREVLKNAMTTPNSGRIEHASEHVLQLQLVHPTNPTIHAKLQQHKSTIQLKLHIMPHQDTDSYPAEEGDLGQEQSIPQINSHGSYGGNSEGSGEGQPARQGEYSPSAINPSAPPVVDDIYVPTIPHMTTLGLPALLTSIQSKLESGDANVPDYGNAAHFPMGTIARLKFACAITHVGQLNPTVISSAAQRQVVIVTYERSVGAGDNLTAGFIYRLTSAPSPYVSSEKGGAVKADFQASLKSGSNQILLICVFFTDQLPPAGASSSLGGAPLTPPPHPNRALASCLVSVDDLAKSSKPLKYSLANIQHDAMNRRLTECQAQLTIQLQEILSKESPQQHALQQNAALGMLASLQATMQAGSYFKRHQLIENHYQRTNLTFFAREYLPPGEPIEDTFFLLCWCARADRPASAVGQPEVCHQSKSQVIEFFCLTDIRLGRGSDPAFNHAQATPVAEDGCYLVIQGQNDRVDLNQESDPIVFALEAPSQEIRDLWGQTTGQEAHIHSCDDVQSAARLYDNDESFFEWGSSADFPSLLLYCLLLFSSWFGWYC